MHLHEQFTFGFFSKHCRGLNLSPKSLSHGIEQYRITSSRSNLQPSSINAVNTREVKKQRESFTIAVFTDGDGLLINEFNRIIVIKPLYVIYGTDGYCIFF